MPSDLTGFLITAIVIAVPIIVAITFHEASHGFVAWRLGDDTAYRLGRVTFNPLRHIDPVGTIALPAFLYYVTSMTGHPFTFGYAKPVPVNYRQLRNPRRDMVLVAAAGPASNLVLAIASGLLLHVAPSGGSSLAAVVVTALAISITVNVILGLFNMIPLPPLDGGRVAVGLLPYPLAVRLARLERYGMFIVLGLVILLPWIGGQIGMDLDIVGWILDPAIQNVERFVYWITGNSAG